MSIVKIQRGEMLTEIVEMIMEECCACGTPFMIPKWMKKALLNSKQTFYCPNGHGQSYVGKTEAEKLKEQLQKLQEEKQKQEEVLQNRWLDALGEKNRLEKKMKRLTNGVCPCCNRTFSNLHNHMKKQHPEHVSKDR